MQLPGVIIMRNLCALTSMSHAVVSAQNAVPVLEALLMSKDAVRLRARGHAHASSPVSS